jgi:hypothetical protein
MFVRLGQKQKYMKLDHPGLKKEVIPLVLLGASAVCAVLILVKTTSFFAASAKAENLLKRAAAQNGSNDKGTKDVVAKSCAIADDLKKANLFSPPVPKQHPVTSVSGILGDEALIGGKWYKAGDRVQDARIVAVEATQVRIEWEGREKTFAPLQATDQLGPGGSRRTSRSSRPLARAKSPTRRPAQIGRSSSGGGEELTAEESEKSRQKAEKQSQAIGKKELQRASREDANKSQPDKKKKSPDQIRKAKEKAAEKRAPSDIKKSKERGTEKKTKRPAQK